VDLVLEEVMSGGTLLETNPYHDARGRFTSKDAAGAYGSGVMAAGRAAGMRAKAAGKSRDAVRAAIKSAMKKHSAGVKSLVARQGVSASAGRAFGNRKLLAVRGQIAGRQVVAIKKEMARTREALRLLGAAR
jgi:hypothetical protein